MTFNPNRRLSLEDAGAAWALARRVHAGQLRKPASAGVPYTRHLSDVAALASHYCEDEQAILVAILHDTIEESKEPEITASQIGARFGAEVLNRVLGLTNPHGVSTEIKNDHQLLRPYDAITGIVKACDKISNVRDIVELKPAWSADTKRAYIEHSDALIARLASENLIPTGLVTEWEAIMLRAQAELAAFPPPP